jgi:thioredoxin-like negative regulator of GroEL
MSDMILRLAILVLIAVFVIVMIMAVRRFFQERQREVLNVEPVMKQPEASHIDVSTDEDMVTDKPDRALARVHILAFGSEESQQCRVLQAPVLRRVVEAKGDVVSVTHIDAPGSPELTQRYHVLTVPTTVLLDASGKVHAVNYGFTNAQSLLKQVDEILSLDGAQEALS